MDFSRDFYNFSLESLHLCFICSFIKFYNSLSSVGVQGTTGTGSDTTVVVHSMASFQSVKEARNLLFDEDDYVCNIHDLDHGPMALSTIEKFDKREEGALQVADALPDSLPILSLATPNEAINLRDLHNDRPLVITFGSFS